MSNFVWLTIRLLGAAELTSGGRFPRVWLCKRWWVTWPSNRSRDPSSLGNRRDSFLGHRYKFSSPRRASRSAPLRHCWTLASCMVTNRLSFFFLLLLLWWIVRSVPLRRLRVHHLECPRNSCVSWSPILGKYHFCLCLHFLSRQCINCDLLLMFCMATYSAGPAAGSRALGAPSSDPSGLSPLAAQGSPIDRRAVVVLSEQPT
jgi:hypothetical protein